MVHEDLAAFCLEAYIYADCSQSVLPVVIAPVWWFGLSCNVCCAYTPCNAVRPCTELELEYACNTACNAVHALHQRSLAHPAQHGADQAPFPFELRLVTASHVSGIYMMASLAAVAHDGKQGCSPMRMCDLYNGWL